MKISTNRQYTHQSWHGVGRTVASPLSHRGDLFTRKLARFHVGSQHSGQKPRLVVQFGGQRSLVSSILGALLHGRQDAGLFALRNATKSDSCNENKNYGLINKIGDAYIWSRE